MQRLLADRTGAAAVEFAIVLPVLVLFVFGIIEFGRAWNVKQILTDSAREGARIAVVTERMDLTQAQLEDSVRRVVFRAVNRAALDTLQLTVTANSSTGVGGAPRTPARVELSYNHVPFFGTFIIGSAPLVMQSRFVMRNE